MLLYTHAQSNFSIEFVELFPWYCYLQLRVRAYINTQNLAWYCSDITKVFNITVYGTVPQTLFKDHGRGGVVTFLLCFLIYAC